MRPEQIKEEINELALSEKLLLVADIWDSIASENAQIPMPEWQKKELDARLKKYKQGKLKLNSWENVHKELREKYK